MADPAQDEDRSNASQITDLTVEFISIVDRPATGKVFTAKSRDGRPLTGLPFALTKSDDEMQVLYGIVYPADTVDAHGHWANAATIRKAMERFMRASQTGNIDRQHNFSRQDAYTCECWVVRKGDPLFPDEPVGSWAVGVKVLDPDLWRACKAGDYTGFSLAGFGELTPPPSQSQESFLAKLFDMLKTKEKPVPITPEEKTEIAAEVIKVLKAEGVIKAAPPPDTPPAPKPADPAPDLAALAKSVSEIGIALAKLPEAISDTVAKAVAKGATEGGLAGGDPATESWM